MIQLKINTISLTSDMIHRNCHCDFLSELRDIENLILSLLQIFDQSKVLQFLNYYSNYNRINVYFVMKKLFFWTINSIKSTVRFEVKLNSINIYLFLSLEFREAKSGLWFLTDSVHIRHCHDGTELCLILLGEYVIRRAYRYFHVWNIFLQYWLQK